MARVPYLDPADLPEEKRDALDALGDQTADDEPRDETEQVGVRNVYRTMAHNPDLLKEFRSYGSSLWHDGGLTPVERELAILATAATADSEYEWHQHVRIARNEGVSDDQILAIATGDHDGLEPAHAALVEYVRQFVDGSVDDESHERLLEHYDEERALAVGMVSGFYLGLARTLDAFDVEIEAAESFVGWELDEP
jgi:4-carboxymuconolactone decarboxylase